MILLWVSYRQRYKQKDLWSISMKTKIKIVSMSKYPDPYPCVHFKIVVPRCAVVFVATGRTTWGKRCYQGAMANVERDHQIFEDRSNKTEQTQQWNMYLKSWFRRKHQDLKTDPYICWQHDSNITKMYCIWHNNQHWMPSAGGPWTLLLNHLTQAIISHDVRISLVDPVVFPHIQHFCKAKIQRRLWFPSSVPWIFCSTKIHPSWCLLQANSGQ